MMIKQSSIRQFIFKANAVLYQSRTHCKYLTVDFLELVSKKQNTFLTDFFLSKLFCNYFFSMGFFLIWQIVFISHECHLLTIKH